MNITIGVGQRMLQHIRKWYLLFYVVTFQSNQFEGMGSNLDLGSRNLSKETEKQNDQSQRNKRFYSTYSSSPQGQQGMKAWTSKQYTEGSCNISKMWSWNYARIAVFLRKNGACLHPKKVNGHRTVHPSVWCLHWQIWKFLTENVVYFSM